MRKLIAFFVFSLMILMVLMPSIAYASPDPVDVDVTVTLPICLNLWVTNSQDPGGTPITELNWAPDLDDMDYGETDEQGTWVHVCANVLWEVGIKGTGGEWFTYDGGQSTKPVGAILWQDGGQQGPQHLTTSDVVCQDYLDPQGTENWAPGDCDWAFDMSFWVEISCDDLAGDHTYDSIQLTIAEYGIFG